MFLTDSIVAAESDYRAERIRRQFGHHRGTPTVPVRRRRKGLLTRRAG